MKNIDFLKNKRIKYILLGETHGIRENLKVAKKITSFLIKQKTTPELALEWPKELAGKIKKFLKRGSDLNWRSWKFYKYQDGRISKDHINFLEWLQGKKIKIICFDENKPNLDWNQRDKKMAQNILESSKQRGNGKTLAIVGNLHAKKRGFLLGKNSYKYVPLGSLLPRGKTVSVKLNYLSGFYFNIDREKIISRHRAKAVLPNFFVKKSRHTDYDYEIVIKKATPVSL